MLLFGDREEDKTADAASSSDERLEAQTPAADLGSISDLTSLPKKANKSLDGDSDFDAAKKTSKKKVKRKKPLAGAEAPANADKTAQAARDSEPESGGLIDAVAKWDREADQPAGTGLEIVRLNASDKLLVPFMTSVVSTSVHWLEAGDHRGYVRCNGTPCVLCQIGDRPKQFDLLPIYDVMQQQVCVLPIGSDTRPNSLKPRMMEMLRHLKAHPSQRLLVVVSKPTAVTYAVTWQDLPTAVEIRASLTSKFKDRLESGAVRLESVYQQLSNDDLALFPKVASAMEARGITL